MASNIESDIDAELAEFNDRMVRHNLTPTWAYYQELVSPFPMPGYEAYLWKADLLDEVVRTAERLVDLERGGERRSFEVVSDSPSGPTVVIQRSVVASCVCSSVFRSCSDRISRSRSSRSRALRSTICRL